VPEPELSDSDLVRLAAEPGPDRRRGELALCRRYAARVQRYAQRHLGDATAAADMTQLVLLSVIEALREGRLRAPERLGAFVLSTCRHLVWDENRAAARRRRLRDSLGVTDLLINEPPTAAVDRLRLEGCVRELSEREQRVVLLTYCEDWRAEQIAAELGTSSGNVRVLRHRALARLASCLEGKATGREP
jgi:RNA polymerase sigma-70 factor, ECF subfamily